MSKNPYVGPRTFTRDESDIYFGRDHEARELLAMTITSRLVLFYAQSGAGKSSLINTRLIPGLEANGFELLPIGRVSGQTSKYVSRNTNIFVYNLLASLHRQKHLPPIIEDLTLPDFLDNLVYVDGIHYYDDQFEYPDDYAFKPRVLMIDQFEEILTTNLPVWKKRADFFSQLGQALRADEQLWVVLSLREDYVAALEPYLVRLPTTLLTRFYMRRLDSQAALKAITDPATQAGRPFATGVVEKLVDDLRQIKAQGKDKQSVLGQFVEPVQLQIVCYRLWENLKDQPLGPISIQDLEALGHVDTALRQFYEQALQNTMKHAPRNITEDFVRDWFGEHLITEAGTRGTAHYGPEKTAGLPNELVHHLENQHIIRAENRAGGRWYELVHDRLVEPILQTNRQWKSAEQTKETLLYMNGINASTGEYGIPPMSLADFATMIEGDNDSPPPEEPDNFGELTKKKLQVTQREEIPELQNRLTTLEDRLDVIKDNEKRAVLEEELQIIKDRLAEIGDFGLKEGIDPDNLALTGWGIIFPESMSQEEIDTVQAHLKPLLELRREQVETGPLDDHQERGCFKIFTGQNGYVAGTDYKKFLAANIGTTTGPIDPTRGVPYYLLIIGSPEQIPYKFQYQLDVQYAVGRIYFDRVTDYGKYARSVVSSETGAVNRPRQIDFFKVENRDDQATRLSSQYLVKPLYETFNLYHSSTWQYELYEKDHARKESLARRLNGDNPPALLFIASHGIGFPQGDPRQLSHQGALLCQDWPGPRRWRRNIPEKFYFSADDLTPQADLTGMIAFFFACYGAGTPQYDEFNRLRAGQQASPIADYSFIANLPKTMLSRGALAVVGHIERVWGYSFYHTDGRGQVGIFEAVIQRLINGMSLGSAIEYFNERYAELATDLTTMLDSISWGEVYNPAELVASWMAHNDARNYVVIGDPAVRLAVSEEGTARRKLSTTTQTASSPTIPSPTKKETVAQEVSGRVLQSTTIMEIDKPFASIDDTDWTNTPDAIKLLLQQYVTSVNQLKTVLNELES